MISFSHVYPLRDDLEVRGSSWDQVLLQRTIYKWRLCLGTLFFPFPIFSSIKGNVDYRYFSSPIHLRCQELSHHQHLDPFSPHLWPVSSISSFAPLPWRAELLPDLNPIQLARPLLPCSSWDWGQSSTILRIGSQVWSWAMLENALYSFPFIHLSAIYWALAVCFAWETQSKENTHSSPHLQGYPTFCPLPLGPDFSSFALSDF